MPYILLRIYGIYNFNFKDIKNKIYYWKLIFNKYVYKLLSYYYHKSNRIELILEESGI